VEAVVISDNESDSDVNSDCELPTLGEIMTRSYEENTTVGLQERSPASESFHETQIPESNLSSAAALADSSAGDSQHSRVLLTLRSGIVIPGKLLQI
jgi:hypothetical protein